MMCYQRQHSKVFLALAGLAFTRFYKLVLQFAFFQTLNPNFNVPPNATKTLCLTAIKSGPWKRHINEYEVSKLYPDIYSVYGPGVFFVFMSNPDLVEKVMLDKENFPTRGPNGFQDLTKNGLLGLPSGPVHSKHRRIISKFMSNSWLKQYSITIDSATRKLVKKWEADGEGDIYEDFSGVTLEVIMQICTGNSGFEVEKSNDEAKDAAELKRLKDEERRLSHGLDFALKEIIVRTAVPILNLFPSPSKTWFEAKFKEMWVRAKLKADKIEKQSDAPAMIYSALKSERNDDGSPALNDEEIHDELMTVRGASHETTSNTLAWALYLLCQPENQEKLKRLQEEVDAAYKTYAKDCVCLTFDEAKELKYTQNVIYETLRLFPTVPSFPREAKETVKLGDYVIPKGSLVFVSQNSMNRSEKIWENPNAFLPERFEKVDEMMMGKPVGVPNGHQYGFIPFGAGNRTCVGQRLAMLEAVEILAAVVHRFTWEIDWTRTKADSKGRVIQVADVTLGPKEGLMLRFFKR